MIPFACLPLTKGSTNQKLEEKWLVTMGDKHPFGVLESGTPWVALNRNQAPWDRIPKLGDTAKPPPMNNFLCTHQRILGSFSCHSHQNETQDMVANRLQKWKNQSGDSGDSGSAPGPPARFLQLPRARRRRSAAGAAAPHGARRRRRCRARGTAAPRAAAAPQALREAPHGYGSILNQELDRRF